ncbi:MAG TPA: sulfite exporter TauE/SafE family protein [Burkholderiales bacterium]
MDAGIPLALFLLGLASGAHCVGMCGGIVTAFSAPQPLLPAASLARRQLAFNAGRISSYAAAGAIAGLIGSGAYAIAAAPAQAVLQVLASLMLVLIGLYLAGFSGAATWLERIGAPLWRRLQPLAVRLRAHSFAAGAVWGWLPCGLVYGALVTAAATGAPARGAAAMLAFGLGTLPWLLAAGLAAARLRAWLSQRAFRVAAGSLVLAFGVWGLARAGGLPAALREAILCL